MASLSSTSSAVGGGQRGAGSTGLSTKPVGQRHPHSYLSHTFCSHTLHTHTMHSVPLTPTATTSTSSGPDRTPAAPLGRANGLARLLVLQRDVRRRVEQRVEDGFLIDSGEGGVESGGGGLPCDHWPMLPFLSVFHHTAQPHPPFSYFSSSYLLCVSVHLVPSVFLSHQLFTYWPHPHPCC